MPSEKDARRTSQANALVDPETFVEIGRRIHKGESITEGVVDEGFVLKDWNTVYVGLRDGERTYVVAEMTKQTSTVGRNDPKLKTRQHESVRAVLKRLELPEEIDIEAVKQAFDGGEEIDTGYINPYRTTPLSQVVEETFKWYDFSEASHV